MRMPSAAVFGYGPKTILSHRIYPPVAFIAEHRDILDQGAHSADPLDYSDYAEAMGLVSPKKAGDHFVAITQPARSSYT